MLKYSTNVKPNRIGDCNVVDNIENFAHNLVSSTAKASNKDSNVSTSMSNNKVSSSLPNVNVIPPLAKSVEPDRNNDKSIAVDISKNFDFTCRQTSLDAPNVATCNNEDIDIFGYLKNLGPFHRTNKLHDEIRLKNGAKPQLVIDNFTQLNEAIFKVFIYLSNTSRKNSLASLTGPMRVQAERVAFHALFEEFTINNFHKYFQTKIRYGIVHSDGRIEHLNCDDVINSDYNALVLLKSNNIYVIRNRFKAFIQFKSVLANFCRKCGLLFDSSREHKQYCSVIGTKLSIGERAINEITNVETVRNVLDSLSIKVDADSREPVLYLKRSISKESCAVITVESQSQTLDAIYKLYYYNSILHNSNSKINDLKSVVESRKCKEVYNIIIHKYGVINIENLEDFFSIAIKFYVKCSKTNKLLPCIFKRTDKTKRACIVYIIGNELVAPRSHLLKYVKIKGSTIGNCMICKEYYSSACKHSKICLKCLQKCDVAHIKKVNDPGAYNSCLVCRRGFNSEMCYQFHLKKTCKRIFECKDCSEVVNTFIIKEKHDCATTKCGICFQKILKDDISHQCLIKQLKPSKNLQPSIRIFFDIEAFTNAECYQKFEPCLLVAQSSCDMCTLLKTGQDDLPEARANAPEQKCPLCKSFTKVFLGLKCVEEFIEFLLRIEIEYSGKLKTIYIISHNGGRFDNYFIFSHLLSNTHLLSKPPLMRHNKILILYMSRILKFLDSINFLPIALDRFAKTFNLKEPKTQFPHGWLDKSKFEKDRVLFPAYKYFDKAGMSKANYIELKNA